MSPGTVKTGFSPLVFQQTAGRRDVANGVQAPIGDMMMQCGPNDVVCNGPLQPDASYQVRYRLYVGTQYQDYSTSVSITTCELIVLSNCATTTLQCESVCC